MKKIGMVIAVEVQSALKKYAERLEVVNVTGYKVYWVQLNNKQLYIVQSGAGEIRAGAATQMLISNFSVEFIINYGVVGALTDELSVTRTCVVEKAVHYDMDTSEADGCEVGRYLEYRDIYLPTTPQYVQKIINYDNTIRPVICASGDKFIADENDKKNLHENFNADICDMESAAVILICDMNGIPNLIIKTVSDSINGGAAEFHSNVEKAADICVNIVDELLTDL